MPDLTGRRVGVRVGVSALSQNVRDAWWIRAYWVRTTDQVRPI